MQMVPLWRLYQGGRLHMAALGGGLAAAGLGSILPETGGSGDQAALMLDAFGCMTAAERKIQPS